MARLGRVRRIQPYTSAGVGLAGAVTPTDIAATLAGIGALSATLTVIPPAAPPPPNTPGSMPALSVGQYKPQRKLAAQVVVDYDRYWVDVSRTLKRKGK